MRRAERLFRLINEMRSRGVTRASELADTFGVSLSTIYRDIAHLQGSGLPIEGEAGVGYVLRPGFDLPNVTFTYDQIDALAVGLSFVERTGDPGLASAAREVRAKLQASLPRPEDRTLADAPFHSLHRREHRLDAGVVREAIRTQRVLRIAYEDGAGAQTERRVRPLVIWSLTDGWMVSGWCELREDFRTFRSDRIVELTVTKERFEADEQTSLRTFMEQERCGD
ncbi:MAG: YafY family protein [Deltaproteobacteria bacterium]|jgi:predicted DNA-binding transcriptional regulator YafY